MLQSILNLDLHNKRVFIRTDFNVPMNKHGEIADTVRIDHALPLIKHVLDQGGVPVIATHLGRPDGKYSAEFSLRPIQMYLQTLFSYKVALVDPTNDLQIKDAIDKAYEQKGIVLFENLRFWPGEEANDSKFAEGLAKHIDVYVNEAFSASHREHASITSVARLVPEKAMGFLFEKEMTQIAKFVKTAKHPEVVILGGAKIDTKIGIIHRLMKRADTFLIGGALANTFLLGQGNEIGKSKADEDKVTIAQQILKELQDAGKKVVLPIDVVVKTDGVPMQEIEVEKVKKDMAIYDIGLKTIDLFCQELEGAKTVIWNGPLGYFEREEFRHGTQKVLEQLQNSNAETLLGGGDTVTVLDTLRISMDKFSYVSLSGGAMIEYIEHLTLPGIKALES